MTATMPASEVASIRDATPALHPESTPRLERRPLTTSEYLRMGEIGLFQGERLELIEGEMFRMSPIGPRHAWILWKLAEILRERVGPRNPVLTQTTLPLSEGSTVEPDLALLREREYDPEAPLAKPSELLLVVEVSDTTLSHDRRVKAPLYARAAIPEYWIVDVGSREILVHLDPCPEGYRHVSRHPADARIALHEAPSVIVDFSEIFR